MFLVFKSLLQRALKSFQVILALFPKNKSKTYQLNQKQWKESWGTVTHNYNDSTLEPEAEESQVWGQHKIQWGPVSKSKNDQRTENLSSFSQAWGKGEGKPRVGLLSTSGGQQRGSKSSSEVRGFSCTRLCTVGDGSEGASWDPRLTIGWCYWTSPHLAFAFKANTRRLAKTRKN